ncbi:hypothetical protein P691DRAFT_762818 [Macrolepiota fuliginosa MF-IS2]|uniref:DUF6534 domain-containing protein n=1 Tax=Macrolepiota fuliginosa MF-IS2 TaxID=1400762 RepID=A0A9P5X959_9AGAR|nr:hypothetical protein P691DRAFT_762818 [Macrolepiota fuliginosa MF-IS2]
MNQGYDGNILAAPFVGFVVGTALIGVTILQSYQYFVRYTKDSMFHKVKIATLSLLDLLHFVFSADIMYTFLISDFGVLEASIKNIWSIKALATTQARVYFPFNLSQLIDNVTRVIRPRSSYSCSCECTMLPGTDLHTFQKPIAKWEVILKNDDGDHIYHWVVCDWCRNRYAKQPRDQTTGMESDSHCVSYPVFCYELQKIKFILVLDSELRWVIYFGLGTIAVIDTIIATMTCFVLYKGKISIGIDIRPRMNRVLSNLIMFAFATGLLTSFASVSCVVLFFARPDTLLYIAVTFSITRLYTNSALAMVNVRQRLNTDLTDPHSSKSQSAIMFPRLISTSSMRARTRWDTSQIGTPVVVFGSKARNSRSMIAGLGSGPDHDVEAQDGDSPTHLDAYSPYYSPLEARKQLGPLLQAQEPEEVDERFTGLMTFWKAQKQTWFGFPIDRRSTL